MGNGMNKLKTAGVALVAMLIGVGIGGSGAEEPLTVIQTKAPSSCHTAINIDNDVFDKMSVYLVADEVNSLTEYVQSVTDRRVQAANDCLAK